MRDDKRMREEKGEKAERKKKNWNSCLIFWEGWVWTYTTDVWGYKEGLYSQIVKEWGQL